MNRNWNPGLALMRMCMLVVLLLHSSCGEKPGVTAPGAMNPQDSIRVYHYYNTALADKNIVTAEAALRKGITLCRELRRPKEEGFGYTYLSAMLDGAGEYDKAARASDSAIRIFRRIGYRRGAYFKAQIGLLAGPIREGKYVESMDATLKLLAEARAAHDTFYIARLLSINGINAYYIEDYPAAIRYSEEGVALVRKMNNRELLLPMLCDLAMIYNGASRYRQAAITCHEAIPLLAHDWRFNGYIYSFLGDALLAEGKADSAAHYLELAAVAAAETGDAVSSLNILTSFNAIYRRRAQWQPLLQSADSGIRMARATNSNSFLPQLWVTKAVALEGLGQYRQALQAQRLGDSLAAAIAGDKVQQNMAVLEARHKAAGQQRVIRELNARMYAEQVRRIAISILLVMAVVVAVAGIWLWQRQRRLSRKVAEQARGLAVLIRELHHRVKNNLQLVASMLYMQQQQSESPGLQAELEAAIGRINSITLIHQHLYRDDVTDGMVSMQEYLLQLRNAISTLHEKSGGQNARITLDAEQVTIDISTAVPVGLILAELMTNSFRHAQVPGKQLHINIRLAADGEETFKLDYRDNGPGIPADKDFSLSMGMQLVDLMARQAGGELTLQKAGAGVHFEGHFKTEAGRQKIA